MAWVYATRILAAALFTAAMYGLSRLTHALIDVSVFAGPVMIAATFVIGVMIENSDRRRDRRPQYSWRDAKDDSLALLVPACFCGAIIGAFYLLR